MNPETDSAVLGRVESLEARCRSLQLLLIVCGLFTIVSLLLAFLVLREARQRHHQVLEAKAFVVRDSHGREAIRIGMSSNGMPSLLLTHSGGSVGLGVSYPYSPFLQMRVVSGVQLSLGVEATSETDWERSRPYFQMGTGGYPDSLTASVLPDGTPSLRLEGSRSHNSLILSLLDPNAMRAALADQNTDEPEQLDDFIRRQLGRAPDDVPSIYSVRGKEIVWSLPQKPAQ